MTDNNKHLVSAGHELASELKADCGAVDVRSVANLLTELASALDVQTARIEALAAENSGLKNAISCHAAGFTVCEACGEENISGNDDVCRALNETPVTDAFLAEVRAHGRTQGIYFVANRMLAAWEHGFIESPESEVIDVARMILSSVEMLPDAEEEDFERDFADEMMGVLTDSLRGNCNGGAL